MKRKWLAVGIILLFIGTAIIPSSGQNIEKSSSASRGNWLYVGGSGPGNYTKIQDAIDNASDGDTVFVYKGIYNESITIEKALTLTGEDKNFTIINAQAWPSSPDTISVEADMVIITGFTIRHETPFLGDGIFILLSYNVLVFNNIILKGGCGIGCYQSSGILISENIISENYDGVKIMLGFSCDVTKNYIVHNNFSGIDMYNVYVCHIADNTLMSNSQGISIHSSHSCTVENNSVMYCKWDGINIDQTAYSSARNNSVMYCYDAMTFYHADFCEITSNRFSANLQRQLYLGGALGGSITHNVFENSSEGIELFLCEGVLITENSISNHTLYPLLADHSFYVNVTRNNFKNNNPHLYFWDSTLLWNQNYWGRPMILPKPIIGMRSTNVFNHFVNFPVVNFDWHPAKEPYDIPGLR